MRALFGLLFALLAGAAQAQVTPGTSPLSGAKGGTNNAFMQFTGPASSLKTFALPNTSDTIDTLNAIQTITAAKTFTAAVTISSASANALAVGANGATNPAFNIDASTAASATGLNVKSAAAGGNVAVSALSSATNEGLLIDAKGFGTVSIASQSTGNVNVSRTMSAAQIFTTTTSANALAIGPNNITNPVLNVDASSASQAAGLNVKGAAAGAGVALSTIDSATNSPLSLNAKGSGAISIGNVSTGAVTVTPALNSAAHVITSSSVNALTAGPNGATNPAFNIDASTASSATGLNIKSAAAAGGVAVSVLSSGTNEGLLINAKGTGGVTIGNVSTGQVNAIPPLLLGNPGAVVGSAAFGNATSGTETIQPATGALGSGIATLPAGTYNLVGDSLTQTLTNKSIAATQLTGTLPAAQEPAHTNDCTNTAGSLSLTCLKTNGVSFTAAATAANGQLPGTATNDNASSGNVGEFICAQVTNGGSPTGCATNSSAPVSLSNGIAANVTSVPLPAGDWDVCGNVAFGPAGTTTQSANIAFISSTSATLATIPNNGAYTQFSVNVAAGLTVVLNAGCARFSLSGTTTVFLEALANFAVSTNTAYGFIGARRRR